MNSTIKFFLNKASETDIAEHLEACDADFVPPLTGRVEINSYAKKIVSKATRFEAWSSGIDFLAPELPYEIRGLLDAEYPPTVSVGDATYRADYDLDRGQVLLRMIKGSRRDAPPLAYLPKFPGLRICVEGPRGVTVLRAGR